MKIRIKFALICYQLAFLLLFIFGVRYVTAHEFMPYHAHALGTDWSALPPAYRVLFLALLKVAGGGMVTTGIAGTWLIWVPFRQSANWARWALCIIGLSVGVPTLYATATVALYTPASPPWMVPASGIGLILAGFLLSYKLQPRERSRDIA